MGLGITRKPMKEEPLRLARLAKAIEKALGVSLGDDVFVYLTDEDLREWVRKSPDRYLRRLEVLASYLRAPDYLAYVVTEKRLFLIKEILTEEGFEKITFEIVFEGRWHLKKVFGLTAERFQEIRALATVVPAKK